MYSRIKTCILKGLEGHLVEVETDMSKGLPTFNIVGLADMGIKEAKERVWSAIKNSGYEFPLRRITINLAPANLRKVGSQLDLPIAVGILSSSGTIDNKKLDKIGIIGELSLDGKVNKIKGALPIIIHFRDLGIKECIVPLENLKECSIFKDMKIKGVKDLKETINILNNETFDMQETKYEFRKRKDYCYDFSDIKGQEGLKRALEISAAGNHNILIIGPPGSGKTMAAKRLPSIMPDLSFEESIEVTKIYSISELMEDPKLIVERPFRSPHHTSTRVALIGGGKNPKPGEVSLAHNGILFLDELPEFQRSTIEVLRQPLEDGEVNISRINGNIRFPAKFILVASMNPCPCGYYGDITKECSCSLSEIERYLKKISNPLLDRIDIHIEVSPVKYKDLTQKNTGEKSKNIKKRIEKARELQRNRFANSNIFNNSEMNSKDLNKFCKLEEDVEKIMEIAFKKYGFSARTYDRILRVSRTIADLDLKDKIESKHLLEAIGYRTMIEKYWK